MQTKTLAHTNIMSVQTMNANIVRTVKFLVT